MTAENTPCEPESVADRNVERLLGEAYKPEVPDPAFVRRVQEALASTARELAPTRSQPGQVAATDSSRSARSGTFNWGRFYAAAAAVSGIALLWHALHGGPEKVPDADDSRPSHKGSPWHARQGGLTPQPRPAVRPGRLAAVGETIRTGPTARQRRTLADGSVLFVNANSTVTIAGQRRVALKRGEVFVEVAPRPGEATDATFVVQTPKRSVAALGTKFDVRVNKAGTGVVVTQGKVKVSDVAGVVSAGQELLPCAEKKMVRPAPRASHVLDWMRDLMIAAESPLVPGSKHAGGALVAVDPWGEQSQLSLRKYHIDVHIEDGFARTTIDQTYFNHNHWRMEGTFYFPLPPDASLSRLAMYVDGKLREGGMAERDHARTVYETILHTQRDPALLEWVDGSTFKIRVFPLEGRQEKRIILSYTQRLASLYGTTRYRFPTGHSMEFVDDWSFHARVKNGGKLHCRSDSHKIRSQHDGADLVLDARARNVKPERDVTLEITDAQMAQAARFSTGVQTDQDGKTEARYLMLRYRPQLPGAARRQRRDWVILFESSGDRNPLLARAQVEVVRTLLANAEHDDTFSIVTAGTRPLLFNAKPLPAKPGNLQTAIDFLDKTHLVGALALGSALDQAVAQVQNAKNPYLVHVGSGIPILGERRTDVLAKRIPRHVHYVGVGVGKHWGRHFMKTAAERTGGYVTQINPDEPITWRAFELMATLNTPRLMDLKVTDAAGKATFLAHEASLAQGEQLCAIARLDPKGKDMPQTVVVRGTLDGKRFEEKLPVAVPEDARSANYLPRTWAKLEIDRLLALDGTKHKSKIIELSKQMYVMSPYTSLLVLENDDMHKQFKIDFGRKDHWAPYACPREIPVVYEPLEGQPASPENLPQKAVKAKKVTVDQVLKTILVRVPPRFLVSSSNQQDPYAGRLFVSVHELYSQAFAVPVRNTRLGLRPSPLLLFDGNAKPGGMGSEILDEDEDEEDADPAPSDLRQKIRRPTASRPPADIPPMEDSKGDPGFDDHGLALARLRGHLPLPPMIGIAGAGGFNGLGGIMGFGGLGGIGGFAGMGGGMRGVVPVAPQLDGFAGLGGSKVSGGFDWFNAPISSRFPGITTEGFIPDQPQVANDVTKAGNIAFAPDGRVLASRMPELLSVWDKKLSDKEMRDIDSIIDSVPVARRRFDKDNLLAAVLAKGLPSLLYQRPRFSGAQSVFTNLVSYAPGMNTSPADIRAVLEAEVGPVKGARTGKIEAAARLLIDRARQAGWQSVTISGSPNRTAFPVLFNGAGQYVYERVVWEGLRERVVCDGKNLWHLYPDLAIGAQRTVSRFHRAQLNTLVPWALPPVDDLAHGADVRMAGPRTVAVIPHHVGPGAQKTSFRQLELVFAEDGRLARRRLVAMPAKKLLYEETYTPQGAVKRSKGKQETNFVLRKAGKPDLAPDLQKLVVVPMPLRTYDNLVGISKVIDNDPRLKTLDSGRAIALIATDGYPNLHQNIAPAVWRLRFQEQKDQRLGFYTLLVSNYQQGIFDRLLKDHPREPLARYLDFVGRLHTKPVFNGLAPVGGPEDGFINHLATLFNVQARWTAKVLKRPAQLRGPEEPPPPPGRPEEQPAKDPKAAMQGDPESFVKHDLAFAKLCQSPLFRYAVLDVITNYYAGSKSSVPGALAAGWQGLKGQKDFAYIAGYEAACATRKAGQTGKARRLFKKLNKQTLDQGLLPRVDRRFLQAFQDDSAARQDWDDLLNEAAAKCIANGRHSAVISLAWQCHELGEVVQANRLFQRAVAGVPAQEKRRLALSGVSYLLSTRQYHQADKMVQPLLEDKQMARHSLVWRLAAFLASNRGKTARATECMERALDIEYRHLPKVINLQEVREDYGNLLTYYQQVAAANALLEMEPDQAFLAKVVRVADRWRSLDNDPTTPCQLAAGIFKSAGKPDLAWQYYTTPLSVRPNEAAAWLTLARTMSQEGELELADRAYSEAFEAEPTNAQILWDRATLLQQRGKAAEAQELFRKIANGTWQPRFGWIQSEAERYAN